MKRIKTILCALMMAALLAALTGTGALAADGPVAVGDADVLTVTVDLTLSEEDQAKKAEAEAREETYIPPVCSVSLDLGDGNGAQPVTEEDSLQLAGLLASGAELLIEPPEGYCVADLELTNASPWTDDESALLKRAVAVSGSGAALSLSFADLSDGGALDGAVLSGTGPNEENAGYQLTVSCVPSTDTPVITYLPGEVSLPDGVTLVEDGDVFRQEGHPVRYPELDALHAAFLQGKEFAGYQMTYVDGPKVADPVSENDFILPYADVELEAQWDPIGQAPHFTITADSGTWEYDGTAHTKGTWTVSPDPAESGYTLENVTVTGSVTSPADGSVENRVEPTFTLKDPFGYPVTGDALSQMVDTVNGTLSVSPRSLTVTAVSCALTTNGERKTASEISTQDGVFHNGYHADGLLESHELLGDFVTGNGTETFPTAIDEERLLIRDRNTHETVDKAVYYSVTTVPGTVTITSVAPTTKPEPSTEPTTKPEPSTEPTTKPEPSTKPEPEVHDVVVTLKSGTWTYDGQAHHQPDYEITGLVDGDRVKQVNFKPNAVITDAGFATNDIQGIEIVTADGKPVPDGKYKVSSRPGTLRVSARNLTVTAISGSLTSSGGEIYASSLESPDHEYQNGYKAEGLLSGHRLSGSFVQGNGKNGFQTWIDTNKLTVLDASNRDVTANYAVHTVDGYITINIKNNTDTSNGSGSQTQSRINITVSAKSGTFAYDGNPHTLNSVSDVTVSGLVDGDTVDKVTFKSTSTITNAGTQNNEVQSIVIKSATGAAVDAGKYNITYVPGKLTVTKFPLTLTAVSDSKVYDGKALNNKSVKSTALANSEHKLSADYEVYDANGNSIKNGPVDVGVYVKKVSNVRITSGSQDVTANYEITMEDGTLTILTASGGTSASTVTSTAYYGNTYTIRSDAPYSEFQYLLIDGQKVGTDQYTVKEGSTIITLKASYIQGLKTGKHNYSIVSTSRQADGSFTVSKAPKTADGTSSALWIILLAAVLLALLILWYVLRNRSGRGGRKPPKGGRGGNASSGSATARGRQGASARATQAQPQAAHRKKPVSDTVMDFETFFGSDANGRPRREEASPAPDEAEEHDPTKDLLPDFRIDLDAYRTPAVTTAAAFASAAAAAPEIGADPEIGMSPAETAEPDGTAAAAEPAAEVPVAEPAAEETAAGEPAAAEPDVAEPALDGAGTDEPGTEEAPTEEAATAEAGEEEQAGAPAEPAPAAEKAIGEMSMDEFLAGFSEMMSDSDHAPKTTAVPEGGAYVGRHEAGAGRRAPAANAGGWYQPGRPEAPDEKTDL